jgi:magnesium chelatase subunit I
MLKENSHNYKINHVKHEISTLDSDDAGNETYRQQILKWAGRYDKCDLPDFLRNYIARLYVKHNLESIRAIEAMQQGALLYSVINNRDQAMINDVTHMLPQVLKHRVDGDTLIKMVNDVDVRGTKDGILNFKSKKNNRKEKENEENKEYFQASGRPLKDLGRQELINTEKTLNTEV